MKVKKSKMSEKINQRDDQGRLTGLWRSVYQGSNIISWEGSYKDDRQEGYWKRYYLNGTLCWEGQKKDNLNIGLSKTYFDNGILKKETVHI